MRICIVGEAEFDDMPGGASRHLSGLVAELRRGQHDVHVLTSAPLLPTRGILGRGFAGRLVRSAARVVAMIPATAWFVVRHRPEVVNVHFPLDALGAVVGSAWTRRPLVATFHGPWALEAIAAGSGSPMTLATAARRSIEKLVYRRARTCLAMSRAFADLLVREYGVDRRRVHVVPLGIDLERFAPRDRSAARQRLNLREEHTVVTVRRLVRRVGLDLAIQALARIPAPTRPRLVIAGTGPERANLETLAWREGVRENVVFLGFVPDALLPDLYAAADVCVVPSRELEGFGYGALEPLAAGTPVIAVRTGGLIELVGDLEPRWLVSWDPEELAQQITAVLASPGAYPSRAQCREYAERFSWRRVAAQTLDVFRAAAA